MKKIVSVCHEARLRWHKKSRCYRCVKCWGPDRPIKIKAAPVPYRDGSIAFAEVR